MMRPALSLEWLDPLYYSLFDHERFASRLRRSSALLISSFAVAALVALCEAVAFALIISDRGRGYLSSILYGWILLFSVRTIVLLLRSSAASLVLEMKGHEHSYSDRIALHNYALFLKAFILPFSFIASLFPVGGGVLFVLAWSVLSLFSFISVVQSGRHIHSIDFGTSLLVSITSSLALFFLSIFTVIVFSLFIISFFIR